MSITEGTFRMLSNFVQCLYAVNCSSESVCHWNPVQLLHLHISQLQPRCRSEALADYPPDLLTRRIETFRRKSLLSSTWTCCTAGVPVCPPWGVTVQLSTCAPAGTAPLQASGLRTAAAQSLLAILDSLQQRRGVNHASAGQHCLRQLRPRHSGAPPAGSGA